MNNNKNIEEPMLTVLRQPYSLTMSKHNFNVHEMRLMMRCIQALQSKMSINQSPDKIRDRIKEDNLGHLEVVIPVKSTLVSKKSSYQVIKKAVKSLKNKNITLEERGKDSKNMKKEIYTSLIIEGSYDFRSDKISLTISKHLLPFLLSLSRGYTQYFLEPVFSSSSVNTMKIYQMLSHWRDKKTVPVNLDLFRKWLKIEDNYAKPAHIKLKILEPAMRELKEKADVWFDIAERIKDGRRMIGWKFNIYTKQPPKKPSKALHEATQTASPTNGPKPPNAEHLENKLMLNASQAKQIVAFFNKATPAKQKKLKTILQEIQWAIRDKKIHTSIGGYVTKTINETFKGDLKI